MPIYQVINKPFWTANGPVSVGGQVDLPAHEAGAHSNLRPLAQPPLIGNDAPTTLAAVFGGELANLLMQAGYSTAGEVAQAGDRELLRVPGIGRATLRKIRKILNGHND